MTMNLRRTLAGIDTNKGGPAEAFGKDAKEGGQDDNPLRFRMTPRSLLCLGCLSVSKKRADVIRQLGEMGCIGPMGNSPAYRDLRSLVTAGLIRQADGKKYELTAAGKRACPDKSTFETVAEAVKVLEQSNTSPRRQLILGSLIHGPKTCGDIVNLLVDQKIISPMAQSNIYRELKAFEAENVVTRGAHGIYEPTESGMKLCPDEGTYARIAGAYRTLLEIDSSSPESKEKPFRKILLAKKAALSLAKLDGVVTDDILA